MSPAAIRSKALAMGQRILYLQRAGKLSLEQSARDRLEDFLQRHGVVPDCGPVLDACARLNASSPAAIMNGLRVS